MKQLNPCTDKLLTSGVYLCLAADSIIKTLNKYDKAFDQHPDIRNSISELKNTLAEFSDAGHGVLEDVYEHIRYK
jgi:hypothetical protein